MAVTRSDNLEGAEFVDANLRGARFRGVGLVGRSDARC